VRVPSPQGIAFRCPECGGCAAGLPVLRKGVAADAVRELWQRAREAGDPGLTPCPMCDGRMAEAVLRAGSDPVTLDVCVRCRFVWFDREEREKLPARAAPPAAKEELSLEAREKIGLMRLRTHQEKQRSEAGGGDLPEEGWMWVPALLGLPLVCDAEAAPARPWLTFALTAAMACVFAVTARDLEDVVNRYGLVPEQAFRYGGLTFLTSFFLHGGFGHLLSNGWFLVVFGRQVEGELGPLRFGLLIAAAALAGDIVHILGDPRAAVPCIGASGGITGVIAFYALRHPRARLGLLLRFGILVRWISLSAVAALCLWLLLQAALVIGQLAGETQVSALAHAGGFAAGLGAFLAWRGGMTSKR
jgi:membrane associated rhomboid family serine protease